MLSAHDLFAKMFRATGLPSVVDVIVMTLTVIVFLLMSLIITAFVVYLLSALFVYVAQVTGFVLTRARRPVQSVALSHQAATKHVGEEMSVTEWSAIHLVVATGHTVLLFTGRNSAIIIPKSAFASPEEADQFAASAAHFWTEATGGKDAKKHPEAHF